ncbi:MAG: DUF2764 domain-containing protein [Bacteroidaceae bacterium]|nr:DUF2764 domain-containing protein [Bacteroidaceae bacterium]
MTNYYCLVTGLPELSLEDGKLSYTVANFKTEIYPELSKSDKKLVDLFYLKYDNQNLLALLKDKEAVVDESFGNYSADELLDVIASFKEETAPDKKFPSYFYEFSELYLNTPEEERFGIEDKLHGFYYHYAMKCGNKFVSDWFELNLNVNNILAAMAARKYKMDVAKVAVGTNFVAEALRSSNARDFGLADDLEYFEQLTRINDTVDLVEREKKIDLLKWNWMEDNTFFNYFTIEKIFVFLMKLEMIERWVSLDKEKGNEMFRKLIDQLKDEVQIPQEFRNK